MNNSIEPTQENGHAGRGSAMRRGRHSSGRQRGAIAIMFALLVIPLIAICGLAIDLGIIYGRKADVQSIANAIALSAAGKLDGSAAGIAAASAAAASAAADLKYQNHTGDLQWSDAAIRFASSPDGAGGWMDAASATGSAATIFYVKVDTHQLADAGTVQTAFVRILSESYAAIQVSSAVVAGRTSVDITPLAVCAMSNTAAASRSNPSSFVELVEYGFRRGVSYDLMHLNPSGATPLNFVVNPLAAPGKSALASDLSIATVGPYVCKGMLAMPNLKGGAISVAKPFPLGSLFRQLNSRFDQYDGGVCSPNGAPPDTNIKSYDFASLAWTTTQPSGQTAAEASSPTKLQTVADVNPAVAPPAQYGPLWAHAKAVPYSAYTAKPVEPAAGYAGYATSAWPSLYKGQTVKTYPAGLTPYRSTTAGLYFTKPSAAHAPGSRNRRILNVPLLECSTTPTSNANVLGIGRFFMMVPATDKVLAAEFGGAFQLEQVTGSVGIFQ